MNTLRALFRETRLGDHIMPFVSDGVIAAISGISSDCWAVSACHFSLSIVVTNYACQVRNSSTLLYSALIARVFGAKRSKHLHAKHNWLETGMVHCRKHFGYYPAIVIV